MKILKFIILIVFLNSCGYQPLLVNKQSEFYYNELKLEGNPKISKSIRNNLSPFKNDNSEISLLIVTSFEKSITSKNKKGNPEVFNMSIEANLTIIEKKEKIKNSFKESVSYNNKSSKFELKQFENDLKDNLIDKISRDLLIFIQSYK